MRCLKMMAAALALAGCEVNYQPECQTDCDQGSLGSQSLGLGGQTGAGVAL